MSVGTLLVREVVCSAMYKHRANMIHKLAQNATRRGQAAVEFALVLIVLVAILYGILEISRLMLINAELENAAREGVHYATLHAGVDANCIKTKAIVPKLSLIKAADLNVAEPTYPNGGIGPFYPVKLSVSYSWTSLVNFMPNMNTLTLQPLGPIPLQASSTRLIEGNLPCQ